MTWEIREGDALEKLRELPDESVQCVVTSPPYYGLRDYGVDGQIGLEPTLDEFLDRLAEVFAEVRRALRADGTLWLNIGDSYNAGTRSQRRPSPTAGYGKHGYWENPNISHRVFSEDSKAKDLLMVPALLALRLRADGWWLRKEIIWHKTTPLPESVEDRPTRAHEPLYLLSKSPRYYYDREAIREPLAPKTLTTFGTTREQHGGGNLVKADNWARDVPVRKPTLGPDGKPAGGNKRSVWEVPEELWAVFVRWLEAQPPDSDVWSIRSAAMPEAHFATFPPKLVEPCILAGSSPQTCDVCSAPWRRVTQRRQGLSSNSAIAGRDPDEIEAGGKGPHPGEHSNLKAGPVVDVETLGWEPTCEHGSGGGRSVVLDPFAGAGTTGLVALRHARDFIGIELNPEYAELARNRIRDDAPLMNVGAEAA